MDYGIGILPLINDLKTEFPDVIQLWYADNTGELGLFERVDVYFHSLEQHGPGQ